MDIHFLVIKGLSSHCGPVWFGVAQESHTWVFSKWTHRNCHLTQELAGAYKSPCMQLNSGMAFRLQLLVLLFPLVLPMARARAVCHFDFMTGEGSDGCRPGVFGGVRRGVVREISYIDAGCLILSQMGVWLNPEVDCSLAS